MTRRGFLASLGAGATLDPERALWVPGAKLISVPRARVFLGPPFTPGLSIRHVRTITIDWSSGEQVESRDDRIEAIANRIEDLQRAAQEAMAMSWDPHALVKSYLASARPARIAG
jgi:hypothetical protein